MVNNTSSAGDSQVSYLPSGSTRWFAGYNADDTSFTIANGADLNTSRRFSVDTSGNLTYAGVRSLVGTGFPNGVVSAPVGSKYIDTNATNGAIEWMKASGTGNTGWIVSVGDTGYRRLYGELINSAVKS